VSTLGHDSDHAQANLPAVAVALLLLTATTGLALTLADGAFAAADRDPADRRVATALADRMVAADGPLTRRANVLDAAALSPLPAARIDSRFPVAEGHALRVRLDDRTLLERGTPSGGTTVRRVVLVAEEQSVTVTPRLTGNATTLPRRTDRVRLEVDPPAAATVRTVRANDRVVLHDPDGLLGTYGVDVSRFETVRLSFGTAGPLPPGSVELTYYPTRTTKATLAVTVDA
jgi:hypothetical protein